MMVMNRKGGFCINEVLDGIHCLIHDGDLEDMSQGDLESAAEDICPDVIQVKIPDCDPTEIEEIYAYTKSTLEDKTKQVVLDFNMRY